jgi:hypothetical protein
MTILFPGKGEQTALDYITGRTASTIPLTMKLFCNNITPAYTDTAATYTEASGGGYAAIALTGSSWSAASGSGPASTSYAQQTYTFTGVLTTNTTVYGYFDVLTTGGTIMLAEAFTAFTPAASGDSIKITPTISGT